MRNVQRSRGESAARVSASGAATAVVAAIPRLLPGQAQDQERHHERESSAENGQLERDRQVLPAADAVRDQGRSAHRTSNWTSSRPLSWVSTSKVPGSLIVNSRVVGTLATRAAVSSAP